MDGEVARLGFRRFGLRFEKRETTGFSRVADRIKVFLRLSRYEQARKIRNRAKLRVKVSCIQHSFPISSLVVSQFFQLTERKISTSNNRPSIKILQQAGSKNENGKKEERYGCVTQIRNNTTTKLSTSVVVGWKVLAM